MHNHEKLTKREKIVIIGATVVTTCIAGYFGYKYLNGVKLEKVLNESVSALTNKNDLLEAKIENLQEAASEGLYEEAIATVTRKINHLKDRIAYCTDRLSVNGNDVQTENALTSYKAKLDVLMGRKLHFLEAQKTYELLVD